MLGRGARREELPHNRANGVTLGLWREWYRGSTAVVKAIGRRADAPAHWAPSDDPRHWNYWRREILAYRTGLPARLGLCAPEVLDVVAGPDDSTELRLEDVEGRHGAGLTIDDVAAAAHGLGAGQGDPRHQPDHPWLSRGFLRAYTASKPFDRSLLDRDDLWGQPLIAEHLEGLRAPLVALRDERDRLVGLVEGAPRAVCHLDAWMNNVIRRPDGEVVFVDWAFVGDGALGEDPSNLVIDSVMDLMWPVARLDELDAAVWEAYRAGLHAAGWRGDDRLVRLAMCAAAVKYEWLPVVLLLQAGQAEHRAYGRPAEADALFAARAAGLGLVVRHAAEARRLAGQLGR
ncbi:MAG: aminoglycoside phosphotransferase [Acidimicrobiales bacterium]|nr:aminoglycoside phosphotransferase [Acidimicrobiales bacterium]